MAAISKLEKNVGNLKVKVTEKGDPSKNSVEEIRTAKKNLKRMQRKLKKEKVKLAKNTPKAKEKKKEE